MGNDRKQEDRIQGLTEGKACIKSQVFKWFLKTPSEGARWISVGRLFHSRGDNAEKARFLVLSFQTSLGVRPLNRSSWLCRVIQVDVGGRQMFMTKFMTNNQQHAQKWIKVRVSSHMKTSLLFPPLTTLSHHFCTCFSVKDLLSHHWSNCQTKGT